MSESQLPRGCLLNACYSIEKVLGRGGFGITYLAKDTKLNLPVAVKEYLPAPFAGRAEDFEVEPFDSKQYEFEWGLSRFISEAQILAQFKHPNIVRVNAAFEQYGTAYMVMEYEQGESLAQYIRQDGSDRSQQFFEKFLLSIMSGLQGIHDKGFIHRDIKPANLMVRADAERTPVLIDFGSARSTTGSETGQLTAVTSAGYSPVEQHNTDLGEQGPWTDIYALAASIREGLTNEVPRASLDREFAVRAGAEKDPLQPLSRIYQQRGFSDEFLQAIDAGLSIMPQDRPQTLTEWRGMFDGTVASIRQTANADSTAVTEVADLPDTRNNSGVAQSFTGQVTDVTANQTSVRDDDTEVNVTAATSSRTRAGHSNAEAGVADSSGTRRGGGGNKVPLFVGIAALALGGGAYILTQTGADKPVDIDDSNPVAEVEVKPDAIPGTATDSKPADQADIVADNDASSVAPAGDDPDVDAPVVDAPDVDVQAVDDFENLPRPNTPFELTSPVDRVLRQVTALNAAAQPFIEVSGASGTVPDAAVQPIATLVAAYKSLSETSLVRTFPDLRGQVSSGLDNLSALSTDADATMRALQNVKGADVSTVDESLKEWRERSGEQRAELIYSLASLTVEQRNALTSQTELSAMLDEVDSTIRSRLEAGDFEAAARMLEVALLINKDGEKLQRYKAILELSE